MDADGFVQSFRGRGGELDAVVVFTVNLPSAAIDGVTGAVGNKLIFVRAVLGHWLKVHHLD